MAFKAAGDVICGPRPIAIVDGIAWVGCVTVVVGESGSGKTFVMLDLAAAVSAGLSWHGRPTVEGSVAYLSYEGDAIGLRLKAARDIRGHMFSNVYVLRATDPISPRVTRDGEERSIGEISVCDALDNLALSLAADRKPPIRLIFLDTIRASLAGSEDSSQDVSAFLRSTRRIAGRLPDAGIILVHHTGWQDGEGARKRERGSSAWRGNCGATLYLESGDYDTTRGECPVTLRALKVRDAERPALLHLIRRRVELNEADVHGQPITSCVIEPDRRSHEDRQVELARR